LSSKDAVAPQQEAKPAIASREEAAKEWVEAQVAPQDRSMVTSKMRAFLSSTTLTNAEISKEALSG
jgi:hypothetical protein